MGKKPLYDLRGLQRLVFVHAALVIGLLTCAGAMIAVTQMNVGIGHDSQQENMYQIIVLLAAAAGFFVGKKIYSGAVAHIKEMKNPEQKWQRYERVSILQWALLEAPALLSLTFFFLTAHYAFVALAAFLVLLLLMHRPTKTKILWHTGLSEEELSTL